MKGEFIIMINGELITFTEYDDIPDQFEHVIKFTPTPIPGPHTHEEHEDLDSWNDKLQRLMEIERNASSN